MLGDRLEMIDVAGASVIAHAAGVSVGLEHQALELLPAETLGPVSLSSVRHVTLPRSEPVHEMHEEMHNADRQGDQARGAQAQQDQQPERDVHAQALPAGRGLGFAVTVTVTRAAGAGMTLARLTVFVTVTAGTGAGFGTIFVTVGPGTVLVTVFVDPHAATAAMMATAAAVLAMIFLMISSSRCPPL
jgi:hypothetical protein